MGAQLPLLPEPAPALLAEIEAVALELASLGGREIEAGLGRALVIDYKTAGKGDAAPRDPVSELDRAIEALVRERIAARFPGHAVLGEETDGHPSPDADFLWVIDPVDGTSNFLNGFPLVACSIGVLHHGRPVAGAIWCSSGRMLRPGVFHARLGGGLAFDGAPVERAAREGLRRRLAAAPGGQSAAALGWDHRVTGSAALECAFVAGGAFNSAIFFSPSIWDVAAGVLLVRAAGLEVLERAPGKRADWRPFARFEAPDRVKEARAPSLRDWRRPLLIGEAEPVRARLEVLRRRQSRLRWPWQPRQRRG
jgi:myo-inositol-1(or 4)-monophosphatase